MKKLCAMLLWTIAGCAGGVPGGGVPVRDAYEDALGDAAARLSIRADASPLAARPFVPVYYPPEIFPIYVPSRISKERDLLVGEHWVFIKLNDGGWFPEREGGSIEPAAEGTPEEMRALLRRIAPTRFDEAVRK